MADATRTQVNVPLSAEERAAVQEAAKARGISQAEFLRQAAQAAMLENLAEAVPEQGDAIAEFRTMLDRLMTCYQSALEQSKDAYAQASAKVRDDLASLGELLRENKELKQRIAQLESECQAAHEAASEAQTMLNATAADNSKIDELERKLLEAEKALVEAKADHMAQIEAERKAHQDEMIASIVQAVRQSK